MFIIKITVVLDLETGTYKPFTKPNANTMYVSPYSNHPTSITKNIPEAIRKRLSSISSSKEMFESEVNHYQNALNEAGYEYLLEFKEADARDNKGKKKRRRNVIWFNPPFSKNVKTNLGAKFLSLIRKHFPKGSEFYKLFNSKKVKLAYSCCPSMKQIISRHNNKVLREDPTLHEEQDGCNCQEGVEECPFHGNCLIDNIVYKATVNSQDGVKDYIGQTMNSFKTRFSSHKNSFSNTARKKATSLSSYVWNLKEKNIDYQINWSKVARALPYQGGGGLCNLCNMEKTLIVTSDPEKTLNKRTEIMGKCRHKWPYYLNNYHGLSVPTTVEEEVLSEVDSFSEEEEAEEDHHPPGVTAPVSPQLRVVEREDLTVHSEEDEEDVHHTSSAVSSLVHGREEVRHHYNIQPSQIPLQEEDENNSTALEDEGVITRRRRKNLSKFVFYELT